MLMASRGRKAPASTAMRAQFHLPPKLRTVRFPAFYMATHSFHFSFRPAPRITDSGRFQLESRSAQTQSLFRWNLIDQHSRMSTLRMLNKSLPARICDPWCWPKGSRLLGQECWRRVYWQIVWETSCCNVCFMENGSKTKFWVFLFVDFIKTWSIYVLYK